MITALLKILRRWLNRRRIKVITAKATELRAMRRRFALIGAIDAAYAVEALIRECDVLLAELVRSEP